MKVFLEILKNRNEFLKLMDECKAGNVDLILTKSISRFSRNSLDCLEKVRMLKNLPKPVYVLFEKEGIFTKDEKSDLMISIFGSIAQEERSILVKPWLGANGAMLKEES